MVHYCSVEVPKVEFACHECQRLKVLGTSRMPGISGTSNVHFKMKKKFLFFFYFAQVLIKMLTEIVVTFRLY